MNRKSLFGLVGLTALLISETATQTVASTPAKTTTNHEWHYYGGDSEGSKYSALTQINRDNVNQLKVAWVFHTGDLPPDSMAATFECTPLVVDGVMYVITAFSKVIALEAESGKVLWTFDPKLDMTKRS